MQEEAFLRDLADDPDGDARLKYAAIGPVYCGLLRATRSGPVLCGDRSTAAEVERADLITLYCTADAAPALQELRADFKNTQVWSAIAGEGPFR
jgi:hypothetical protein